MGNVALQLILLYLIWGLNFVVMKVASGYFASGFFVAARFTIGAVLLFLLGRVRGKPRVERRFFPWIMLSGVLLMGIHNLIVQMSAGVLGSGLTAVLDYTMPLWTTLIAAVVLKERLTLRKIFGILLSIAGMAVLMNVDADVDLPMVFLMVGAAMLWAAATILVKRHLAACDPLQYSAGQMAAASVVLWIYSFANGELRAEWTPTGTATLLYSALLGSAVGFLLWNRVLSAIDASQASVAVMAVPVVGVISGVVLLHETLTVQSALGMAAILLGILMVLTAKRGEVRT